MNAATWTRLAVVTVALASSARAADGVTDVWTALDARRGQPVVLMLRSGATLEGKVTGLSTALVTLSGVKGAAEAHVRVDDVSAVLVQPRKEPPAR